MKRALGDHHRGEIAHRADGVMTDPADLLWAIVPCEEFVADFEGFDGALFACGKAQACAACERNTRHLSKAQGGVFCIYADEAIVFFRLKRCEGHAVDLGDMALFIDLNQEDDFDGLALGIHQGDAAVEHNGCADFACLSVVANAEVSIFQRV